MCANKKIIAGDNDLATTHPYIAAQWHPTKNGELTPQMISYGYEKNVWWQCRHGHEWKASPATRINAGSGCPVCSNYVVLAGFNDLETVYPDVAKQWHPTKNDSLTPKDVVFGSNKVVWWRCDLGHEWRARIVDRTRNANECPYCSNRKVMKGFNDLATTNPMIAAQWHPELNGKITPEMVTAGSSRRVWWICHEGHVWRTAVCNRAGKNKRTGCPICAGNTKFKSNIK